MHFGSAKGEGHINNCPPSYTLIKHQLYSREPNDVNYLCHRFGSPSGCQTLEGQILGLSKISEISLTALTTKLSKGCQKGVKDLLRRQNKILTS